MEVLRELLRPKWSEAFRTAVERETGSADFTYVIAVTVLKGDSSRWENEPRFQEAMNQNPIQIWTLADMLSELFRRRVPRSRRRSSVERCSSSKRAGGTQQRQLKAPRSARQPSCLRFRKRAGVTAVAVRHSVLRTSFAATAASLRLRHAVPAVQLTLRTIGAREQQSPQLAHAKEPSTCTDEFP